MSVRQIALAVVVSLAGMPAVAEGWTTTCHPEDGRCTAMLALSDAKTKRPLASIGIQAGKGSVEPSMIAFLPLGVELKPGFRAVIGGKEFRGFYEVCFPDGCRVVLQMAPKDLDLWLSSKVASLQFFPYGSGKPVAVDAPLAGLRDALKDVLPPAP